VLSGVPQGSALGIHLFIYLFIAVICNSIKHAEYFLFADTIKIAHSVNFSTDSTLPKSDIDSICDLYAADFMKLNTDETTCKVRCTVLTTYCLNQTKR